MENGHRNVFMTRSSRKNVPDVGIEPGAACMPSEHASDRATAPGRVCLVGTCIINIILSENVVLIGELENLHADRTTVCFEP